jgi:hypothetical protein
MKHMFDLGETKLSLIMANEKVKEVKIMNCDESLMFKLHLKKQTKKEVQFKKRELKA